LLFSEGLLLYGGDQGHSIVNKRFDTIVILPIQVLDFLLYLTDFLGQLVQLSEIISIRFDYELLVVFL